MKTLETTEDVLDHILSMVEMTEPIEDLALGATATIYRLMTIGESDLALAVLNTYKPEEN